MLEVILIYPSSCNDWRRSTSDMVQHCDKKFNWFVCAKKYWDDTLRGYIVEVGPGIRFYDPKEGKTYTVKQSSKLLLTHRASIKRLEKNKLQGYGHDQPCPRDILQPDASLFCHEARFFFLPDILTPVDDRDCDLLLYSKTYQDQLRQKIPQFPSAEKIEKMIEEKSCDGTCRELYQMVDEFIKMS